LTDVVACLDISPDEIEDAFWELVGAGLATADGFASLRVLVDRKRGEVKSLFDKRAPFAAAQPTVRKWQEAIRKARTRDRERPSHALRSLPTAAGRWSLLPATAGEAIDAEASARQLLHRYGVVFRDLVARESSLPPWRDILVALRRLEARGEIRGGRFVSGMSGEQFALPDAVERLREVRRTGPDDRLITISAADPLNFTGILTPGDRIRATTGSRVVYRNGVPVAAMEGEALKPLAAVAPGVAASELTA
jgi:ATP-dependent Lhr-like helicase